MICVRRHRPSQPAYVTAVRNDEDIPVRRSYSRLCASELDDQGVLAVGKTYLATSRSEQEAAIQALRGET